MKGFSLIDISSRFFYNKFMLKIIVRLVINALAIFITAQVLPGVQVEDLSSAFIIALVLGLINTFIKPILLLFTLPLNFMTLGLFTFVLNALIILLVDYVVAGFEVANFWYALLFSLVLSIVSSILIWIAK